MQLGNNMDNQEKVEIDDNNLHQDPRNYSLQISFLASVFFIIPIEDRMVMD